MTAITTLPNAAVGHVPAADERQYLTLGVGGQSFAIPALRVHDVLKSQPITRVPLAPREIAGALNLRGRVVTAIELRLCLGLPPRAADAPTMSIVIEQAGELYSLLVDTVGEVLTLAGSGFERSPATLSERWRELSSGVHRLDGALLVLLDIDRLFRFDRPQAA